VLSAISDGFKTKWHHFLEWGVSQEEKELSYPCDRVPNPPKTVYFRGVTIGVGVDKVFPWLCQMKIAPYSYDWLDNFGRQSPRCLTDGLTDLTIDQVFMTGFKLVDYELNSHVTIRSRDELPMWMRIFGDIVISYSLIPLNDRHCRLVVKLRIRYPKGKILGPLMRIILPPGDTFMMHKQINNFKELAELNSVAK